MGPAGPPGPAGSSSEIIFIERSTSQLLYEDNGYIVEDSRISPETYLGLYLKAQVRGNTVIVPLEEVLLSTYSLADWPQVPVPAPIVAEGAVLIIDLDEMLVESIISFGIGFGASFNLAVAVLR